MQRGNCSYSRYDGISVHCIVCTQVGNEGTYIHGMYLYDTYKCFKKHKYKWYIYESHDILSSIQTPLPSLFLFIGKKNRFILFFLLLGKILLKIPFILLPREALEREREKYERGKIQTTQNQK